MRYVYVLSTAPKTIYENDQPLHILLSSLILQGAFFSHTQSTFITHPLVILHYNYSRKPQRVKLMGEANALYYTWVLPPI